MRPEGLLRLGIQNPGSLYPIHQPLIFSGYEVNGRYSDNEGQLLCPDGSVPYRFIDERLPDQAFFRGGAAGQAPGDPAQAFLHDGQDAVGQLRVRQRGPAGGLRRGLRLSGRPGAASDAH